MSDTMRLNKDIEAYNNLMIRAERLENILKSLRPDARTVHVIAKHRTLLQGISRGHYIDDIPKATDIVNSVSEFLEEYFKNYTEKRAA